ncbi:MAG: 2-amino-4-ketopentanoate thiolase [Clostridiales bacterium]|jgi:hypothetical protein|nr:2-amino-4-ketopentanoate thiolase [Clostridiales bacterium]
MVKAGTWVEIRNIILEANERATNLPEDTAAKPLIMWVKGNLIQDSKIGEPVQVQTATGRLESGILEKIEPVVDLGYGQFVAEILEIRAKVRGALNG